MSNVSNGNGSLLAKASLHVKEEVTSSPMSSNNKFRYLVGGSIPLLIVGAISLIYYSLPIPTTKIEESANSFTIFLITEASLPMILLVLAIIGTLALTLISWLNDFFRSKLGKRLNFIAFIITSVIALVSMAAIF